MNEFISELKVIFEQLQGAALLLEDPVLAKPVDALRESANQIGKAWSQSWLGYQSRVYYAGLKPPPPGAHFSSEWGFKDLYTMGTSGDWQEFSEDDVETAIRQRAGYPDISKAQAESTRVREVFQQTRDDVISILGIANRNHEDLFLDKLSEEAEKLMALTADKFIEYIRPSGQIISRDMIALGQGLWTPPHFSVLAQVFAIEHPKTALELLSKLVRRAFSHLERMDMKQEKADRIGTNVFIGHGRSKEWIDLKDFIKDRMRLPWDEFNRIPVAGIPNTVRLSTMLDASAIAFLVLTGEDEMVDGGQQARMNVIHESGLFQGRLGFTKAIVMLEEGCAEFSNIEGLGQIRFPKKNIKAAFHDVQLVLEREGLIQPPNT